MPPEFGTSGLRGLVTELSPDLVGAHVRAFLAVCDPGAGLRVGRDLRDSSPAIAAVVMRTARAAGVAVTDCGVVPTPALALAAAAEGAAAVMVTGSHIPADRNGLKFYTPDGEITKADEAAIAAAAGSPAGSAPGPAAGQGGAERVARRDAGAEHVARHDAGAGRPPRHDAGAEYVARHVAGFGPTALGGRRVGVWSHAAAGRDLTCAIFRALGAEVVELDRSEVFVPVDTEAVDAATRARLAGWAEAERLDAIVATDGDGDRPLMTDAAGRMIAGDVLGQIAAAALGAEVVVTPVSSNTGAEASGRFARVVRTRIGSPHVIAAMQAEGAGNAPGTGARVAGFEANGGFLLGFAARGPAGPIPALMTRDAVLPMVAALWAAGPAGLAARVAAEPSRVTAAGLVRDTPTDRGRALVDRLSADAGARAAFLAACEAGAEAAVDRTDGLRVTLAEGRILHLRPSGNAPEMRLYTEAETPAAAQALLEAGLAALGRALDG